MTAGRRVAPLVLGAAVLTNVVLWVTQLNLAPALWPDSLLYASIARARQLYGVGVPSIIWFSPKAVDHIPFYGPVYFDLVALSFKLLGVSLGSFRLISLLGAGLVAAAAAMLSASLSEDRRRWLWAVGLVLLTPSLGFASTSGDMETMAVGLELLSLSVCVRGLVERNSPVSHGAGAGAALTLAALTTPRTYPFVFAFLAAGALLLALTRGGGRSIRVQFGATAAIFAAGFLLWTVHAHGDPIRWFNYMSYILTREDSDVAILSTSVRQMAFSWSSALTPLAAASAGVMATVAVARSFRAVVADRPGILFALVTAWIAGLVTVWGMNLTFSLDMYFAIPLFAVVLALPRKYLRVRDAALAAALVALVAGDVAVATLKWARIAATWSAHHPGALTQLVRSHVPAGAAVVGPDALYFFVVEESGASYRSPSQASLADWARWVPEFDPAQAAVARRIPIRPPTARFLIWQTGDDLPSGYECARPHLVGAYLPPANGLARLGRFGDVWDVGYPATSLYRLPAGCPEGYDPAEGRNPS